MQNSQHISPYIDFLTSYGFSLDGSSLGESSLRGFGENLKLWFQLHLGFLKKVNSQWDDTAGSNNFREFFLNRQRIFKGFLQTLDADNTAESKKMAFALQKFIGEHDAFFNTLVQKVQENLRRDLLRLEKVHKAIGTYHKTVQSF